MTENEAIKVFKELLDVPCEMLVKYDSVTTEEQKKSLVKIRVAEDMAIQALEEIQQYKAIGTIEEFKALKEKIVAKKPRMIRSEIYDSIIHYYCPNCGRRFGERGEHNAILFKKDSYCQGCGQLIDWE